MDFSQNTAFSGLGTVTFIAASNGNYIIEGKITLPLASQGAGESAVVCTINKNGSPVMVTNAASEGFKQELQLITTDTVTIVLSSAAAADQPKNVVKSTISISSAN